MNQQDIKNRSFQITVGTAIAVVVFVISGTVWFLQLKDTWEKRLDGFEYKMGTLTTIISQHEDQIKKIQEDNYKRDLQLNSFTIKLENIESTLLEVKTILTKR